MFVLLAVCFSFWIGQSMGVIPGLLFDCILEKNGMSGCTDSWGEDSNDEHNDDNNNDDDTTNRNLPTISLFILPILFCVISCCCWTGAAAICTAACSEERKESQGIADVESGGITEQPGSADKGATL